MKILIITNYVPPVITPNVIRWISLVEEFKNLGHNCTIFSTKSGIQKPNYEQDGDIIRVGYATLRDWKESKFGDRKKRGVPGSMRESRNNQYLEKLIDKSWRSVYWPDGSCIWYFPARKGLREWLISNTPDVVISVGLPFTAHLLGKFAKEYSPNSFWIMDVEDPFCFSKEFRVNNWVLYKGLNHRMEKRAMIKADKIVITNTRAKERYHELFPEVQNKFEIIPPVLVTPTNKRIDFQNRLNKDILNIGYVGSFYDNIREVEPFITWYKEMISREWKDKICFHFWGKHSKESYEVFETDSNQHQLIDHGLIPHSAVAETMQQIDILIHFGNSTDYHLPSKVVEYIFSGKPIVNIIYSQKDSFMEMVGTSDGIIHLKRSLGKKEAINQLNDFFIEFAHRRRTIRIDKDHFSPATLAKQYLDGVKT